jgi:hypothetical protein
VDSQGHCLQCPLPYPADPNLLMKPASDVHGQVGVPSECIAPLSKGMDLVHWPGRLLRREDREKRMGSSLEWAPEGTR